MLIQIMFIGVKVRLSPGPVRRPTVVKSTMFQYRPVVAEVIVRREILLISLIVIITAEKAAVAALRLQQPDRLFVTIVRSPEEVSFMPITL